jgi:predicted RNA-binding Zn ribbon-like protein
MKPRLTIDHVLAVANSAHGPGGHIGVRAGFDDPVHDHLAEPSEASTYLQRLSGGIADPLPGAVLDRLRSVRRVVTGLLEGTPPPARTAALSELGKILSDARYRVEVDGTVSAARVGWIGFADDLLLASLAIVESGRELRRCANDLCRFLFIDTSRSGSRRWCDMSVCGNRAKGRRARARKRSPATASSVLNRSRKGDSRG